MTSLSVKIGDQAQTESDHHVTILRARSGWQLIDFREIWHFRDLLWVLALRDIQVRYKQAVLGILWAVIQPVATVAIFGVVFGELLGVSKKVPEVNGQVPPYAVYLFAAQLPWLFFQSSVNTSSNSLVANANMLRKIYLPKLLIPLSALGAPLIDFALGFVVFVGVMVYYDVSFNLQMLMLPLLLISVILVSAGVGIMLSALTVTYRDFRYVVPFMMQLWFFVTPVLYPPKIFEGMEWVLYLNPMAGPIESFRAVILGTDLNMMGWGISTAVGAAMVVVALAYFSRVERRFADIA